MTRFSTSARRQLLLAAGALALAAPLSASAFGFSFGGETVRGNGAITKQARQVPHFNAVSISVPGKVELRMGGSEGLNIETDDNLTPLVQTTVEKGVLRIRPVRDNLNLETHTLRITVNAREIDQIALAGSASVDADALHARRLEVSLGGSGSINARSIDGDELAVQVAGSGNLSAGGGAVGKLNVSLTGSGDVNLGKLRAGHVGVNVVGSGNTMVWAANELDVAIVGSGDVRYNGEPKVSRKVIGSGEVQRAGGGAR
jgi:hypothetical protein